mgnify:FL=1
MFHYNIQGAETALCGIDFDTRKEDEGPGLTPHMRLRSFFVIIPGTDWGAAHIHTRATEVWGGGRPHCRACTAGAKMLAFNPKYT